MSDGGGWDHEDLRVIRDPFYSFVKPRISTALRENAIADAELEYGPNWPRATIRWSNGSADGCVEVSMVRERDWVSKPPREVLARGRYYVEACVWVDASDRRFIKSLSPEKLSGAPWEEFCARFSTVLNAMLWEAQNLPLGEVISDENDVTDEALALMAAAGFAPRKPPQ